MVTCIYQTNQHHHAVWQTGNNLEKHVANTHPDEGNIQFL